METIDIQKTSNFEVLELIEKALQTYNEQPNLLDVWNKLRKRMFNSSSKPIRELEIFAKHLKENINQNIISGEDHLDQAGQAKLLHILYGLAISKVPSYTGRRGVLTEIREKIKFEDSTTYEALLEIRVLILGNVFTECTETDTQLVSWAGEHSAGEPLNRTIKLMVDRLYDGNALFTEPQKKIYLIYFHAKDILQYQDSQKVKEAIHELNKQVSTWLEEAKKTHQPVIPTRTFYA